MLHLLARGSAFAAIILAPGSPVTAGDAPVRVLSPANLRVDFSCATV